MSDAGHLLGPSALTSTLFHYKDPPSNENKSEVPNLSKTIKQETCSFRLKFSGHCLYEYLFNVVGISVPSELEHDDKKYVKNCQVNKAK